MAWRKGDRVRQPLYGPGEVTKVSADRITVAFDDGPVRKFVVSIVQLLPSDAPRPARPQPRPRRGRARKSAIAEQSS